MTTLPPLQPPEYLNHRLTIRGVLEANKTANATDLAKAVAHHILMIELSVDSRFLIVDDEPHLFTGHGKKLVVIQPADPKWVAHLFMVYDLNTKDNEIVPKVTQALRAYVTWNGRKATPRRWTAFVDGALYLSGYNGTAYKLTGAGVSVDEYGRLVDDGMRRDFTGDLEPIRIDLVDNGSPVLFIDDDNGSMPEEPVIGRNGKLFSLLRGVSWQKDTAGHIRPKHQVRVMMIWMLALAFPDIFPTKPLLLVEGASGSGKSTLLQIIQKALYGSVDPFVVSKDGLRDFWVTLIRSPIMILDNCDDPIDWVADNVCAYCTKGYRNERKLHTNTGRVELRPNSFIAVPSKDPRSFRREDTVDRSLVLRMGARKEGDGLSMADIERRIEQERAQIYGEWIYFLNRTVAALKLEPPRRTTTRLGDFEIFAYAACRALGLRPDTVVPDLMAALGRERTAFAAENDVVLDVLHDWAYFPHNQERVVPLRDLYRELSQIADTAKKPFVRSPLALAQRLRAPHLTRMYDVVEKMKDDQKTYTIKPAIPAEGLN